jgi:hypothetical protein
LKYTPKQPFFKKPQIFFSVRFSFSGQTPLLSTLGTLHLFGFLSFSFSLVNMPRTLSAGSSDVKDHRESDKLQKDQEQKVQQKDDKQKDLKDDKQKDDKQKDDKQKDQKDDKQKGNQNDNKEKPAVDLTDPEPSHHLQARLQTAPEGARHNQEPANTKSVDEQKSAVYTDSETEKKTDRTPLGPQKDTSESEERFHKGNAARGPAQQDDQAGKHDLMPPEKAPQGADESKPLRNKMPNTEKQTEGGVKNSERKDHQKQRSPAEERKMRHEQSLAHHPHLYEELERRKNGHTPLDTLEHIQEEDFGHTAENDNSKWLTGNFKDARERRRQEEQEWRERNKRDLSNLHDIQHWQRRETKDWERSRQQDDEHKDHGILESIGSFASDKWNSLTHGSEDSSDKQWQESHQRSALGERTNVRQEFPVQKPGSPVHNEASPLRQQQEPAKSWWPFSWGQRSQLQHMPSWRENTRLIDSMTDDELSMMAL